MIEILEQKGTADGWEVKVKVDDLDFTVTVDRKYWEELTEGEELIRRSFEFLLKNEPKESILRRFNLKDIEHYFPNYPNEIKS